MSLWLMCLCPELCVCSPQLQAGLGSGFLVLHPSSSDLQPSSTVLRLASREGVFWKLWYYKRSQSRNLVVVFSWCRWAPALLQRCWWRWGRDQGTFSLWWSQHGIKWFQGKKTRVGLGLWHLKAKIIARVNSSEQGENITLARLNVSS